MKKIALLLCLIILASCSDSSLTLTTKEDFTKIKEMALENFGGDTEVFQLEINAEEHLEATLGGIEVGYVRDGVQYRRVVRKVDVNFVLQDENEAITQSFIKNHQGKIKIKDLDFDSIETKFQEAISQISDEYEGFSLNSWEFEINNKNEITSRFTIEATKAGETSSVQGRNIVTNYYDFVFELDKDGKLSYDE